MVEHSAPGYPSPDRQLVGREPSTLTGLDQGKRGIQDRPPMPDPDRASPIEHHK